MNDSDTHTKCTHAIARTEGRVPEQLAVSDECSILEEAIMCVLSMVLIVAVVLGVAYYRPDIVSLLVDSAILD